MRAKKFLKIGGITLLALVTLLLLFVVAFVFNPFEGRLRDMRDAVPRSVDYFLRKTDLGRDFVDFPEPRFWDEFQASTGWERIRRGPAYRELVGTARLDQVLEDVRDEVRRVREDSTIDLLGDLAGTEVLLAGRLKNPLASSSWCLYARVSWKVKLGLALARYAFVQERARRAGVGIREEDDLLVLELRDSRERLYAGRHLDCLVLGNDRDLVTRSLGLARGSSTEDTLGGSSDYRDGIQARLREWKGATDVERANALEFYLRPEQLLPIVHWDDNWPDPNHPTNMNERVAAAFINLAGWRFLSGALIFEGDGFSLLGRVMLNQNLHTSFQAEFFRTEARRRGDWLDPFLALVPENVCALAAMRMPAGPFLRQMYLAMDKDWRDLVNESLRRTGVYEGVQDLIAKLEVAFLPRTGFLFRKNVPDPQIPVSDKTPLPQIAWVFWIRPGGGRAIVEQFVKNLYDKHRIIFGGQPAYELPLRGRGDRILECTNPQIPATGEVAFLIYDQFFVVSNSGPLIKNMFMVRDGDLDSILVTDEMQMVIRELPQSINGFVYVQGRQMEEVLVDVQLGLEQASQLIDPEWAMDNRSRVESQVFARDYRRYGSLAAIPRDVRPRFDDAVNEALEAEWARQRGSYTRADRASLQQLIGVCRMFGATYLQVILSPQTVEVTGRTIFDYR